MGKEIEVETPEICIGLTVFIGSSNLFLREILGEGRDIFRFMEGGRYYTSR